MGLKKRFLRRERFSRKIRVRGQRSHLVAQLFCRQCMRMCLFILKDATLVELIISTLYSLPGVGDSGICSAFCCLGDANNHC